VCFEKKITRSPTKTICLASSFIVFWADLQQKGHRDALGVGAAALKVTALNLHPHKATALTEMLELCR